MLLIIIYGFEFEINDENSRRGSLLQVKHKETDE